MPSNGNDFETKNRIGIIGAGAAGLFAAVKCIEYGSMPTLFEKNARPGKKLLITGKGRCNITNDSGIDEFMKNTVRNPRFLYKAYTLFGSKDTIEFFGSHGVSLKTERGKRVFPASDRSSDILKCLTDILEKNGVEIISSRVTGIKPHSGSVTVKCEESDYFFDKVIIATGGASYKSTGSTGDGYRFAKQMKIDVIPPSPALVPLVTEEKYVAELMGLSLKNVRLDLYSNGSKKPVYSEQGEMLFTHFGISGPMVLSASSLLDDREKYHVTIDLKPALDEQTLDKRVLSDFSKYSNRDYINSLGDLLPSKMIPVFAKLSGIDPRKKVNEITKEERKNIVRLLKCIKLNIKSTRPIDEGIITRGGINVKEIDPHTMRSVKYDNVYFAGEIIDVDALTGGFNLQIALSTANLAALSASEGSKMKKITIAIDGQSGCGKSTLAKNLAKELGIIYVDTGALYRSVGLYMYENGISADDNERIIGSLDKIDIKLDRDENGQIVLLNGENVNGKIRTPAISTYASKVSAIPEVRKFLLELQQRIPKEQSVIMDGRDIGTVIIPDATVKIYLCASDEARAKRRYEELIDKGEDVKFEDILKELIERDKRDSERDVAPAVAAPDAVRVDNSDYQPEDTFREVLNIIREKIS